MLSSHLGARPHGDRAASRRPVLLLPAISLSACSPAPLPGPPPGSPALQHHSTRGCVGAATRAASWGDGLRRRFGRRQQVRGSAPAFTMILGSNICIQKTLYEVLSVTEDATYEEIRAAYKSAALNTHPDKAQTTVESSVSSNEQQEFLSVQKAWDILRHPNSRAEYDKQLQSSRQNIEIIASEIEVGDMIVESTADTVELLYPCRCGDYFSITSTCALGEMGILITEDGVELQTSDSVSASIVLGCGSCSLKTRLVINKAS